MSRNIRLTGAAALLPLLVLVLLLLVLVLVGPVTVVGDVVSDVVSGAA